MGKSTCNTGYTTCDTDYNTYDTGYTEFNEHNTVNTTFNERNTVGTLISRYTMCTHIKILTVFIVLLSLICFIMFIYMNEKIKNITPHEDKYPIDNNGLSPPEYEDTSYEDMKNDLLKFSNPNLTNTSAIED